MEASEYGLTRGMNFVACRLEVVAVAGLLWISWCVLGAAGYISCFLFSFFFFERTRPTASIRLPRLIDLFTCIEAVFGLEGKASSYRGAYRVPLFYYSVCVCNVRRFY